MSHVYGYVRVSTNDQTVENQKQEISNSHKVQRWFEDSGVSGSIKANDRKGMNELMITAFKGDTVIVSAIDRLGRDTIDVLKTVEAFEKKGVKVVSLREGFDLSTPTGKAMLTIIASLAKLEKDNLLERQMSGIKRAKSEGVKFGRKVKVEGAKVAKWRSENNASIKQTALHFDISPATVKRHCILE